MIKGWHLDGLSLDDFPRSMAELEANFTPRLLQPRDLPAGEKWEPIISHGVSDLPRGWVELDQIARFRRGIATGCNAFFLVPDSIADQARIGAHHRKPCVGRSADVAGLTFRPEDLDRLRQRGRPVALLTLTPDLSADERSYVQKGEAEGIHERYLTRMRRPWFLMEKRPPAPIWAAVFGRDQLRFVLNEANALSLTTFHCVFPDRTDPPFLKALCLMLNARPVRARFDQVGRRYGGGLKKFEPNDLKRVQIPDLRQMPDQTIAALAAMFDAEVSDRRAVVLSATAEAAIEAAVHSLN